MKLLEEKIIRDGKILAGDVLKVDSFINHQMDVPFLSLCADEFYNLYKSENVNKILTIEASGIGIACITAMKFDCPVLFAKKSKTSNLSLDVYSAPVMSYTHGVLNNILVSKNYLNPEDRVLIIDDFLATGSALVGLLSLCQQAGATVVGCGILVEKAYQNGGELIRKSCRVESLARISKMSDTGIEFI